MKHMRTLLLCGMVLFIHASTHAQCTATGPLSSATGGNDASIGTLLWTGTGKTVSLNNSYAAASVTLGLGVLTPVITNTRYLTVTNLGFNIPPGNIVCGIVVTIDRRSFSLVTIGGTVNDNDIRLIKGGALVTGAGANHALAGDWPYASLSTASYGNNSDLWGDAWLPSDINSTSFGVAISASIISQVISLAFSAEIDQVTVTVYSGPSVVLAVPLQRFSAKEGPGGNTLSWTTSAAAEGIASHFMVQRSPDSRSWQDLANIPAQAVQSGPASALGGQQNGTSAQGNQQDYSYTDANPLPGTNSYRLHLLNADGQSTYSEIKTIEGPSATTVRCYPNPFSNTINISSPGPIGRVQLKDMQGRVLLTKELNRTANVWQWPATGLLPGLYFVQVDEILVKLIKN